MQAGKNAAASIKEAVANVGASAKSGMDKTKAVVQEKIEKMTAHDEAEKEMAGERKDQKIHEAQENKQQGYVENAASKEATRVQVSAETHGRGLLDYPSHQMSALQGQGTGEPHGQVTEGVVRSHPVGTSNPMGGAHNPRSGSTAQTGYGTGGGYN